MAQLKRSNMETPSLAVSKILKAAFQKAKSDRRKISIRYLAGRLNLSPTFVYQIINGQRAAKPEIYKKFCEILDIENEKREFILNQCYKNRGLLKDEAPELQRHNFRSSLANEEWTHAPQSTFKFLKSWKYIAILETTMLGRYDGTPDFIANNLNLDIGDVKRAIQELKEANLLQMKDGKLKKSVKLLDFSSAHSKKEIQEFHKQNLDLAKDCLESSQELADANERLIASFQFVCRKSEVLVARQRLTEFFQMLASDFAVTDGDEIYQFSAQLFPLRQARRKTD